MKRLQVITLTVIVPDDETDQIADLLQAVLGERGHTIMVEDLSVELRERVDPAWSAHRLREQMLRAASVPPAFIGEPDEPASAPALPPWMADPLLYEPPADGVDEPDQPGRYTHPAAGPFTSCEYCPERAAYVSWAAERPGIRHHLCREHQAGFVIVCAARREKILSEPLR